MGPVSRRIERRPYRVGSGEVGDPIAVDALLQRCEKHDRLTRNAPARTFGEVLEQRAEALRAGPAGGEEEGSPEVAGVEDPLLGLGLGQDRSTANRSSRPSGWRSGKVIVRG